MIAPACAISLVLLLAIRGKRHPGGELAGGISYPLYLNAWIAVFTVNAIFKHFGFRSVVVHETLVLILSISLATLLYWFFDRQLLARRNQLYSPRIAQVTMFVAYGAVALGIVGGLLLLSRTEIRCVPNMYDPDRSRSAWPLVTFLLRSHDF